MRKLLWILGIIVIIAAVVSPINIILWGSIGILMIAAGCVLRSKNK
jgi:cytochrome c oxidase assembly factor CtaG